MSAEAIETKSSRKNFIKTLYLPVAGAGLLALGYFAGAYRPQIEPKSDELAQTIDLPVQTNPFKLREALRPSNLSDPDQLMSSERASIALSVALNTYNQQNALGSELQGLMQRDQSIEVVLLMEQAQRHQIFSGVGILQRALVLGKSEDFLYVEKDTLGINDDEYDLNNRFELQIAGAWLQYRIEQLQTQMNREATLRSAPKEGINDAYLRSSDLCIDNFSKDLDSLVWLKRNHPPITVAAGSFNYFGAYDMAHISRVLQLSERLSPGLINRIEWHPKNAVEAGDKKVGGHANFLSRVINLENRSKGNALTHEIGHLIHHVPGFMEDFKLIRNGETGRIDPGRILEFVSNYAMTNDMEDFASTFDFYINSGEDFRELLNQIRNVDPYSYQKLQLRYDFMRDRVLGEEFSLNVKPRDLIRENTEQRLHGIALTPDGKVFISPDPEAWNEMTKIAKRLPIIDSGLDDGIPKISWAEIQLGTGSPGLYSAEISYSGKPPMVRFQAVNGFDRIRVRSFPDDLRLDENGLLPTNIIELPELKDGEARKTISFRVDNFTPVQIDQARVIFDNDVNNQGVNLRENPGVLYPNEPIVAKIFDSDVVDIIEGPIVAPYLYSGNEEPFWRVRFLENISDGSSNHTDEIEGWIPQRWIGREFSARR